MWLDNASSIDMLFYSPYADSIVKFAKDKSLTPLTIGLYGSWGAGKSSILKIIENKLSDKNDIVCVSLNAWQFEGYEDAKIAIMESLLKSLEENESFKEKASGSIKNLLKRVDYLKLGKNLAKKGLPYALGVLTGNPIPIALNLAADISKAENIIDNIANFKNNYIKAPDDDMSIDNIRKFREEFTSMLQQTNNVSNLTVIIDDLDRCTPERIIDTLEAIKLFLSVEKTTFVIAVDQRIIEYAVKTKYTAIDGYELSSDYIEKIIQLPIKIPELSPKDIENYLLLLISQLHFHNDIFVSLIDYIYNNKLLLNDSSINFYEIEKFVFEHGYTDYCDDINDFQNDAKTIEKIKSVVSPALKGNPRQAKRFLNTFFVRKNLASLYFEDELSIEIIAKLLVLETIDIRLFKQLYDWNKLFNGENSNLKTLENYNPDSDDKIDDHLMNWTKPRILNWLNSEPKELFKIDLSKYFYLSRESLASSDTVAYSFTQEERDLLTKIVECKKGQENARIQELSEMSYESQEKLIIELMNKFAKGEISFNIIAPMFESLPDFQTYISEKIPICINGKLKVSAVPHFKRMYTANSDLITQLLEQLEKANKINSKEKDLITRFDSPIAQSVKRG